MIKTLLLTVLCLLAGCTTDPAGNTPLIRAAWAGDSVQVSKLLERSVDVNERNHHGMTALMAATWGGTGRGNVDVARALISHGANVNAAAIGGRTPLMEVAGNGNLEFTRLLLDHGADANARLEDGATSLMTAAVNGHVTIVDLLLDRGADPNAQTHERETALMMAAREGYREIVVKLLEHGADAQVTDGKGETALSWALKAKKGEVARVLERSVRAR